MATEVPLTYALARKNGGEDWVRRDGDGNEVASGTIAEADGGYVNLHFDRGGWTNTCHFDDIFLVVYDD
ncbi:Uncharacterised protein (plasmid) [Tsukamurella tyrosinosolvens]|uniref:Uncharacterized protein n=1 Tax=Tsukamurella tyrosinosolvens TaxID=57704 RepID=A0A1H4UUC2_TSUTY|nr:hypothetical protein [Tsukamurella tyrosinosolvens]KXO98389.1 hypothetical protein AXK58_25265 [Tsukamurella tyrosinosolvens]SEC72335.1 hypothetical protein SAMN04489793_3039 [Tsukamurella tyrosinosolvens]VEH90875.1 Uncharacterised protein [Tsukamurella tyrosinosolvens]